MAGAKLNLLAALLLIAAGALAAAQNCGCAEGLCCSKYGYCGTGSNYCGRGCKSGPCDSPPAGGGTVVADVVTQQFFDGMTGKADENCEARGFYTRQAFLDALESYSEFGQDATTVDSKREIAAFFAHVSHETINMCYKEEIGKPSGYCDYSISQYPCAPGKKYYGRGPIQISWNYNYGPAGEEIGFDGLNSPETVITDATISFKTALWYWMNNVHDVIGQGFGATIQAINGALECGGKNPNEVNDRVNFYLDYCKQFNVSPGDNLTC